MKATVRYLDGVKFEVTARGHRVLCDQPPESNGADTGMTPPEFLLASLGTCAGFYAAEYLRARSLPAAGLMVHVEADKVQQPARLDGFRIEVDIPHGMDARHEAGILRAVKSCLIHNTLLHSPRIDVTLKALTAIS